MAPDVLKRDELSSLNVPEMLEGLVPIRG